MENNAKISLDLHCRPGEVGGDTRIRRYRRYAKVGTQLAWSRTRL